MEEFYCLSLHAGAYYMDLDSEGRGRLVDGIEVLTQG